MAAGTTRKAVIENMRCQSYPPGESVEKMRAKLFANGRSQAVRLPKKFRMPGKEVFIHRVGQALMLEPIVEERLDANGWPVGMANRLDELRDGLDLDGFRTPEDPVPPPMPSLDEG